MHPLASVTTKACLQHGQVRQGCSEVSVRHLLQPDQRQLPQADAHAGNAEHAAIPQVCASTAFQPKRLRTELDLMISSTETRSLDCVLAWTA